MFSDSATVGSPFVQTSFEVFHTHGLSQIYPALQLTDTHPVNTQVPSHDYMGEKRKTRGNPTHHPLSLTECQRLPLIPFSLSLLLLSMNDSIPWTRFWQEWSFLPCRRVALLKDALQAAKCSSNTQLPSVSDGSSPSTALGNHTGARKMDSAQLYLPTVPQKIDQKGRGFHSFWRGKNIFWPHFPNHASIGWLHAGSDKYWASLRLMYTPKRLDHKREKLRQEGANAACCQDGALLHHTDLSSSGTKACTEVGIWLKADEAPPSATGTHIAVIKQISPEFCEDTKTNYHGSHHF